MSGCGQNRLSHDSSAWRVKHGRRGSFGSGGPAVARWCRRPGRCSPSTVRRPCSATQLICCFARERVDLCGITRRRLPNRRFRLPGLHLGSCPAHRERRATWAGRPGRLVRGKPQPKPYSAPASRASAQAATRRSLPGHRTQPDQIGPCRLELQMQPHRRPRPKFDHS